MYRWLTKLLLDCCSFCLYMVIIFLMGVCHSNAGFTLEACSICEDGVSLRGDGHPVTSWATDAWVRSSVGWWRFVETICSLCLTCGLVNPASCMVVSWDGPQPVKSGKWPRWWGRASYTVNGLTLLPSRGNIKDVSYWFIVLCCKSLKYLWFVVNMILQLSTQLLKPILYVRSWVFTIQINPKLGVMEFSSQVWQSCMSLVVKSATSH